METLVESSRFSRRASVDATLRRDAHFPTGLEWPGSAFVCLVDGILYELDRCSAGSLCTLSLSRWKCCTSTSRAAGPMNRIPTGRWVPSKIQCNRNLRRIGLNGCQVRRFPIAINLDQYRRCCPADEGIQPAMTIGSIDLGTSRGRCSMLKACARSLPR
jgi:hypothetical protein